MTGRRSRAARCRERRPGPRRGGLARSPRIGRFRSTTFRNAKPHVSPSASPSRSGNRRPSACDERSVSCGHRQHAEGHVEADGVEARSFCSSRQKSPVPQATSMTVEPLPSPSAAIDLRRQEAVHAERHDAIQPVVTGSDSIEHRLNRASLLISRREAGRSGHA